MRFKALFTSKCVWGAIGQWNYCFSAIKRLRKPCHPFGLCFLHISAPYSSLQNLLTGLPLACCDTYFCDKPRVSCGS